MTIWSSSQLPPKIIKQKQTGTHHSLTHTYVYISSFSNLVYSNTKQKIRRINKNWDQLEQRTCMNKNGILQKLCKKNLKKIFFFNFCNTTQKHHSIDHVRLFLFWATLTTYLIKCFLKVEKKIFNYVSVYLKVILAINLPYF